MLREEATGFDWFDEAWELGGDLVWTEQWRRRLYCAWRMGKVK